ncbi:unnamed protein product [Heterobilharzia americana]|nr:unnamed protein product [Heterobilharzia americana]CAH8506557.1 unnamed protein product [Heterobilharzia americana]
MYSENYITEWIVAVLIYGSIIVLYCDCTTYDRSNYIGYINTGDSGVGGDIINNEASTTPQYNLRYAITEDQPINFKIGKINDDLLQTPELRSTRLFKLLQSKKQVNLYYRLSEPSNYFDVNESTSILSTKKLIDLETLCPRYCRENTFHAQLNIHVNIWANFQLISVVNIEIAVTDVDDNMPAFPSTVSRPYRLKLKEVIYRSGKHVELPKAIDIDVQPSHAEIVYRLNSHPEDKSNSLETFRLVVRNDSRLVLVLQKDLDYEFAKEYRFYLVCSSPHIGGGQHLDSINTEDRLEIIVEVLNINDIEPTFSQAVYEVQIEENVPINSTIFELKATDKDVNSTITYSMENVDLNATLKFFIVSNGQVIVKEKLDYEQRNSYSITVRASDGEFFALAKLIITILDVNDEPPEYVLNPSQLNLIENKPARTLIGHLLVIDRDSPEVNGQVQCEEPSDLGGKQPILFVQESLYLNQRSVSSSLTSKHTSYTSGNYLPTGPLLSSSSETHIYQRFTLYSGFEFDRENGPDKYEAILYCWDAASTFSSSTLSPSALSIHTDQYLPLNYSKLSNVKLSSLTATMTITLHVTDANDNQPIFEKQYYKTEIKENSPVGTKIIRMHATDKDIGVNAQIHYSLEKNELITPYFKINPLTGWITSSAELDREAQASFQLTVLATDGGYDSSDTSSNRQPTGSMMVHHTTTSQLLIHILDENDNAPEFRGPRQFAVEENQPPNKWIGDLQIMDRDEGMNSEVTFRLLSGKLVNNNSGNIVKEVDKNSMLKQKLPIKLLNNGSLFTTKSLDREDKSHYCFEVIVSDKGVNKSHSTVDTICVRVLDVNDNQPYFTEIRGVDRKVNDTLLNRSLSETTAFTSQMNSDTLNSLPKIPIIRVSYNEVPGYCALVAKAVDEDEGRNAQLRYGITHQYSYITNEGIKPDSVLDAFTMDPPSGRVMLTRNLKQHEAGLYEVVITVEDSGEPVQKAEKTIQLIIDDSPPRGNWLFPEIEQNRDLSLFSTKYAVTEAHTILVVIILSGISAFLASVLITAILCMIKPCRKSSNSNRFNKKLCSNASSINNTGNIPFDKEFNTIICSDYDITKTTVDQIGIPYDDYSLSLLNQQQQFQLGRYTSGQNVDTVFSHTSSPFTHHMIQQHQQQHEGIVISDGNSTIPRVDSYYLPPYKLFGIDNYIGNDDNSNQTTTATVPMTSSNNGNSVEQEVDLMKRAKSPGVQRTSPPSSLVQYAGQQPNWSYLHLEFPNNDCQHTMSNASSCNMTARCSVYSPHHLNSTNPSSQPLRLSLTSPPLVSANSSTAGPDLVLLQCTRDSPISSTYYYHQSRSNSLSPNQLSNIPTVFNLGSTNLMHPTFMHQNTPINIDCAVKDPQLPVQVIGEEQRSDSGRGASDEENSNQIQMTRAITPTTTSSSVHTKDMLHGIGLKTLVNQKSNNHKFRSNTLKCATENSSHITTGLVFPSLPRVNMCK